MKLYNLVMWRVAVVGMVLMTLVIFGTADTTASNMFLSNAFSPLHLTVEETTFTVPTSHRVHIINHTCPCQIVAEATLLRFACDVPPYCLVHLGSVAGPDSLLVTYTLSVDTNLTTPSQTVTTSRRRYILGSIALVILVMLGLRTVGRRQQQKTSQQHQNADMT